MKKDLENEENEKVKTTAQKVGGFLFNMLIILCSIIAIAFSLFKLNFTQTNVIGTSMQPLLHTGDVVFVKNGNENIERGDVVVYETETKAVIKRVIAMEGDRVKVTKIDGVATVLLQEESMQEPVAIEESYVSQENSSMFLTLSNFSSLAVTKPWLFDDDGFLVVPDGEIFCLGDNRTTSEDCSSSGPVEKSKVLGEMQFLVEDGKNIIFEVAKQIITEVVTFNFFK